MPMHDWTRVSAGTFHDFHNAWITHIKETLNAGLLPEPYYALGKQRSGDLGPDVLTLKATDENEMAEDFGGSDTESGLVAVAQSPPAVRLSQEAVEDIAFHLQRQRTVVIYHSSGDRIVALNDRQS